MIDTRAGAAGVVPLASRAGRCTTKSSAASTSAAICALGGFPARTVLVAATIDAIRERRCSSSARGSRSVWSFSPA